MPVQVVQVDTVDSEALQGLFDGLVNVCRVASHDHVRLDEAELGGEEDLVPLAGPLEPRSALNDCERMSERKIRTSCRSGPRCRSRCLRYPSWCSPARRACPEPMRDMNHGSASRATITDLEAFLLSEDVSVGGGDAHGAIAYGSDICVADLAGRELCRRHWRMDVDVSCLV